MKPADGTHEDPADTEAWIVDPLTRRRIRQIQHESRNRHGRRAPVAGTLEPVHDVLQHFVEYARSNLLVPGRTNLGLVHPLHEVLDERPMLLRSRRHERRHV